MKVKVFSIKSTAIEDAINGWLSDPNNDVRKIEHVSFAALPPVSPDGEIGDRTIVLIFYEEKGERLFPKLA
jgi:hypothetical protein